ncbi:MAG TPA: tetratricopeptide repeat protein, partial [Tepidisphaeraceae bacterium]
YRASRIWMYLGAQFPVLDKTAKFGERGRKALDQARQLVTVKDPFFAEINVTAAERAMQDGDRAEAEKLHRFVLEKHPEEQRVRIGLAQLVAMDPKRREEALAILEQPMPTLKITDTQHLNLTRYNETITAEALTVMRLDALGDVKDEADRKAAIAKIEGGLKKLYDRVADAPEYLRLKGRLQLMKGETIDAIQTLQKAQNALAEQKKQDINLMYMLAKAYVNTNQIGSARALLSRIVQQYESAVDVRVLLAKILLNQNDVAAAKPHIEYLMKNLPDNPEVIALHIELLAREPEKNKEELKKDYARLPEKQRVERLSKAQVAMRLADSEDALRLYKSQLAEKAEDNEVIGLMAQVYVSRNEKELAKQAVTDALKARPDDKGLKYLLVQLDGDAKALQEFVTQAVDDNTDPFTQELQRAEMASRQNKAEEALDHLKKAEAIKKDDPRVLEALFQYYLAVRNWDQAGSYGDALGKQTPANALVYKFRLARAKGDVNAQVDLGNQMVKELPEFGRSHLLLGQALQAKGQFPEALKSYQNALDRQSDSMDARRGIIECNLLMGRNDDAKAAIDTGLQAAPKNAYLAEQAIQWDLRYGDPTNAIAPREAALKANSEVPDAWLAMGQTYLRVASAKASKQDKAGSEEALGKARLTFTDASKKWPDEKLFYTSLADTEMAASRPAEAEKCLLALMERPAMKGQAEPHLLMAEFRAQSNDPKRAEEELRTALELSKNNIDVELRLSNYLARLGKPAEALKVLELNPDDGRVQAAKIEIELASGKLDDAEKGIQAQLAKNPNSSELNGLLGFIDLNRQKFEPAMAHVNLALQQSSNNLNALYYRGLIKLKQPKPDIEGAIADLSVVRDQNANNVDVRMALVQAQQMNRNPQAALHEMEMAFDASQGRNKLIRLRLAEMYGAVLRWSDAERLLDDPGYKNDPELLYAKALMWQLRQEPAKALANIEQAVKASPENANFTRTYLGTLLLNKKFDAVVEQADKLLADKKDPWWVRQARAAAKSALGQKDQALAEFKTALEGADAKSNGEVTNALVSSMITEVGMDKALAVVVEKAANDDQWRRIAASVYLAKKDIPHAVAMVEKLLVNVDNLDARQQIETWRLAGQVYLEAKRTDDAVKYYLKALDKNPDDFATLNNLACLFAEGVNPPRPDQAQVYSKKAYDIATRNGKYDPYIADTHGWVLVLNHQLTEGISLLQVVVEKNPFPEARYHLAEAYLQMKPAEAQKASDQLKEAKLVMDKDPKQVDPALKQKVEEALARAQKLLEAKTEAAVNP